MTDDFVEKRVDELINNIDKYVDRAIGHLDESMQHYDEMVKKVLEERKIEVPTHNPKTEVDLDA